MCQDTGYSHNYTNCAGKAGIQPKQNNKAPPTSNWLEPEVTKFVQLAPFISFQ